MKLIIEMDAQEAKDATKSGALERFFDYFAEKAKAEKADVNSKLLEAETKACRTAEPTTPEVPVTSTQQGADKTTTDNAPMPTVPTVQTAATPPTSQPTESPVAPQVPTEKKSYTINELQKAAIQLMDKGLMSTLSELLAGFGVTALPELQPSQFDTFAFELRKLGAQI